MNLTVYLSGEIHSDWREQIMTGIQSADLPVKVLSPVTDHPASDNVGVDILGAEELAEWKDHKAAKINRMRILLAIEQAEIVVVKFGDQYKQWNAAFDAGYAAALGKALIVLHGPDHQHALKEVDAAALAVCRKTEQVINTLRYVIEGRLPREPAEIAAE